jgi:glycosyltransferase involved in cell wall biosynthesis
VNVFISNSTGMFAGGEDYVLILAKHLQQRGHRVWVSANPGHLLLKKCTDAGLGTVPIAYTGMSRVFSVAAEMRAHLQRLSIDIVHSNANYDRTVAAIATAWTRTRHVASVHSTHSIQHNITHWLRNRYGTDHFIADAEPVKRVLVSEDAIRGDRITVIPIGVESFPKDQEQQWRQRTRAAWGVPGETCVIGNVARLVPFKGHRYLVEAIAGLVESNRDVLCVIIGDGELMTSLREQSRELDLGSNLRFLGFQDNLHELYPAFDIYCHASLELEAEAFPLAILRALAAGLPVVATNVGGIGMMVEEGVSGFLTPPEDTSVLGNALFRLLADARLRQSMGKESFEMFRKNFHASAMAERVEQVYDSVAGRQGAPVHPPMDSR